MRLEGRRRGGCGKREGTAEWSRGEVTTSGSPPSGSVQVGQGHLRSKRTKRHIQHNAILHDERTEASSSSWDAQRTTSIPIPPSLCISCSYLKASPVLDATRASSRPPPSAFPSCAEYTGVCSRRVTIAARSTPPAAPPPASTPPPPLRMGQDTNRSKNTREGTYPEHFGVGQDQVIPGRRSQTSEPTRPVGDDDHARWLPLPENMGKTQEHDASMRYASILHRPSPVAEARRCTGSEKNRMIRHNLKIISSL